MFCICGAEREDWSWVWNCDLNDGAVWTNTLTWGSSGAGIGLQKSIHVCNQKTELRPSYQKTSFVIDQRIGIHVHYAIGRKVQLWTHYPNTTIHAFSCREHLPNPKELFCNHKCGQVLSTRLVHANVGRHLKDLQVLWTRFPRDKTYAFCLWEWQQKYQTT